MGTVPLILIIDDNDVSQHVTGPALHSAGIPSTTISSNAALDQLATSTVPSLILIDLPATPLVGLEILRFVRANTPTHGVPVILLSNSDSDDHVALAFELGADDFLRTPYRPAELVARVRCHLRMRAYVETLSRNERDARAVSDLTKTLATTQDLHAVLFTAAQRLADIARVDRCSIVLVLDGTNVGQVAASSDDPTLTNLEIDLANYPEIREVIASRLPLVIHHTQSHPLLDLVRLTLPPGAPASLALVPILHETRTMGVVFLRATLPMTIGEHELSVAQTVANAIAIALRNAHVAKRLRDRTERVNFARLKAEQRLRLLKRYAAFFESGADGIFVTDTDWQVLFSNAKARAIAGFSESELHGRRFDEVVIDAERPCLAALAEGFTRGIYPQNLDVHLRRPDGGSVVISINFSGVLRDSCSTLLSFREVTRERQVEAEFKRTKEFLENVISSSANAIVSVDRTGTVRLFNRAAERCLGRSAEEVVGHLRAMSLFPESVSVELAAILRSPEGTRHPRIDDHPSYVVGRSGEPIPVSLSASQLFDGDSAEGAVIVFTDLRDKMRMEAKLNAAQEELQAREREVVIAELAGATAHELNQPLTSIMGYAELLKRKLDPSSTVFSAAEIIMSEAERMAEIVRKIGKITRYETKSYVGAAKILDLDRASDEPTGSRR